MGGDYQFPSGVQQRQTPTPLGVQIGRYVRLRVEEAFPARRGDQQIAQMTQIFGNYQAKIRVICVIRVPILLPK